MKGKGLTRYLLGAWMGLTRYLLTRDSPVPTHMGLTRYLLTGALHITALRFRTTTVRELHTIKINLVHPQYLQ